MVLKKIKNLQDVVQALLEKFPEFKDDDNRLIAHIWWKHLKNNDIPEDIITMDFLKLYAKGEIPQADMITRARRKVQQDFPHLRGKVWEERHKLKEEVRKGI